MQGWKLGIFLAASASAFAAAPVARVEGELFVRVDQSRVDLKKVERRFGLQRLWSSELVSGLVRVRVPQGESLDSVATKLRAIPGVRYADPNFSARRELEPVRSTLRGIPSFESFMHFGVQALTNDPLLKDQWALTGINGVHPEGAWAITHGSRDIKVAVVDTGGMTTHPDLAGNYLAGYDFVDRKAEVVDTNGHGTHVAGIIGAHTNNGLGVAGLAADTSFIPIRAVPDTGDETDAGLIEAFEFAAKSGARIANCSFGKSESSQAVGDAIRAAGDKGVLFVVAAGNDGADLKMIKTYPVEFHTSNMIVVGATEFTGGHAWFSNYGPEYVDLSAPGLDILSTVNDGDYGEKSGTSMAAPMVSGVAALALAANPRLSVADLKQVLRESVDLVPGLEDKVGTGGRINATKAVEAARRHL